MPTIKQRRAFELVVDNGGNVSRAMRDAGYSPMTAQDPKKLTESVGWHEILGDKLSDEKLLRKHNQLLNAKSETVQLGALDIGYKLKARYADAPELSRPMTINVLNFYEATGDKHSIPIQSETISVAIPKSDGRRSEASSNRLAQA